MAREGAEEILEKADLEQINELLNDILGKRRKRTALIVVCTHLLGDMVKDLWQRQGEAEAQLLVDVIAELLEIASTHSLLKQEEVPPS
jgi:hypothetical protein